VAIVPIYKTDEERSRVVEASQRIAEELREDGLAVVVDDREGLKPGAKYYEWERKGVPLRLEVGPRDLESKSVMGKLRVSDLDERGKPVKLTLPMEGLGVQVGKLLDQLQKTLFERALAFRKANTVSVDTWSEFEQIFAGSGSKFVHAHWDGTTETELAIKDATKATVRCLPLPGEGPDPAPGRCIKTGKPSARRVLFAKNY
jgi:prolyl-tRNA synthetase